MYNLSLNSVAYFQRRGGGDPGPQWQAGIFIAGNNAFGWGYATEPLVSAPLGTLVDEPYTGSELLSFWEAPDDSQVIVTFLGDMVDQLDGYTFNVNGTTLSVLTEATYDPVNNWTIMFLEPFWMLDGQAYVITRVPVIPQSVPVNISLPTITGAPQVDATLLGSDGSWTNDPTSFAYQWQLSANGTSGWTNITGANSPTYTPVLAQVGQYVRIGVTASNDGGSSAPVYSAASGPIENVAPPVLADVVVADSGFNATYPLSTASTASVNITVTAGDNRKLVAVVTLPANETLTGVTAGATPMTLVTGNVVQIDGTRYSNLSIWELANPPLGTITVTATRTGTASVRFGVCAFGLQNADQTEATIISTPYFNTTDATSYTGNSLTATREGQLAFFVYGNELFAANNTVTVSKGTNTGRIWTTGSNISALPFWQLASGAGEIANAQLTIGDTGARYAQGLGVLFNNTTGGGGFSGFFIDGTDGSDSNDGTSEADPIMTLSKAATLPVTSGSDVSFKAGTVARQATGQSVTTAPLAFSASDVTVQPYDTGSAPALFGDVIYASGWGTVPSGEASSFAVANGQKRAIGANTSRFAMPCIDGKMLYPAAWCPSGSIGDPAAFTDYQEGSEACVFTTSVQIGGTAPDFSKEVAFGISGGTLTLYVTHPAIAPHYGPLASDALNGGMLVYRDASNTERYAAITGYSQADSRITAQIGYSSSLIPHQAVAVFWALRFIPFDISTVGQYAFDKTVSNVYATFPAGTVKSLPNAQQGFVVTGDGAAVNGLTFGRICQSVDTSGTRHSLIVSGSGQSITDCQFTQDLDPSRPSALSGVGTTDGLVLSGITGSELYTNGFIRFQSDARNCTFDDLYCRDSGRTMVLFGAGVSKCATNNTVANADFNDHISVHGNGLSTYSGSNHITFSKFACMGSTNPISSQTKGQPESVVPRSNSWSNFIVSHPRSITGDIMGTHQIRIDGSETGGRIDRGLAVVASNSGLYFNVSGEGANQGTVVSRMAVEGVSSGSGTPSGVTDVEFKNCLILQGDGIGQTQSALTALGAIFTDCTFVTLPSGSRAAGTNGAWNGSPTVAMQEHITRTDAWTVAAPVYENVQIGPDKWGINRDKGPWIIPAYGSSFAMADLWLTTDHFNVGTQADKQLGSICGGSPGSTLSLPTGLGNNSLFTLDPRGMVRCTSRLAAAGSYSLVVREANAAASNGPTKDTTITVVVG